MREIAPGKPLQLRLSVIIPTLGSAEELRPVLMDLDNRLGPEDEVLVVQANDSLREPFELGGTAHRMRVLVSLRGRGRQLNCGAAASEGDLLLFLHADGRLPPDFAESIRNVCLDYRMSLGCFRLRFASSNRALEWIAEWANLRTKLFGLPYGDQGFFCRKEIWERAGPYRLSHLMEDVDFVRHCKRLGEIRMLDAPIHASPRRYLEHGIWKASMLNHLLVFGYALGVDNRVLYDRYYHCRRRGRTMR